jgi:diacylglycerol kinase family enzyme
MKHIFVFDPKSFRNQQWKMDNILDDIGQFFRTQEKSDFSIGISHYRRDALVLIQKEAETSRDGDKVRVYAIGGDEILYDCLNGIAELPNTELAVVPYGETSYFLRNFGEGKDALFRNIPALVQHGEAIPTDIINWDVNYALNSCYIGLNTAIAGRLREYKATLNKGSFILLSKISSFTNNFLTAFDKEIAAQQYKITIDDRDYSGSYSLIHIANGPYFAGKTTGLSTKATPDDGLLDVALVKSAHPLKTMWSLNRYSQGKVPSNCNILQAKKITVQSDRQMWIQLDNEYIRDTDINIKVVPHAVQMVAMDNLSYQKLRPIHEKK